MKYGNSDHVQFHNNWHTQGQPADFTLRYVLASTSWYFDAEAVYNKLRGIISLTLIPLHTQPHSSHLAILNHTPATWPHSTTLQPPGHTQPHSSHLATLNHTPATWPHSTTLQPPGYKYSIPLRPNPSIHGCI